MKLNGKISLEKAFTCIASTRKGDFEVFIKVWRETTKDGNGYFGCVSWKSESYVTIDGEKLTVRFDVNNGITVRSHEVAKHYGLTGAVRLGGDYTAPKKYIEGIERQDRGVRVASHREYLEEQSLIGL